MSKNIRIHISRAGLLYAASACAATKNVRFYLNGVHIAEDRQNPGHIVLEGTDGHCAVRLRDPDSRIEGDLPEGGVLIPHHKVIASFKAAKHATEAVILDISPLENLWDVTVTHGSTTTKIGTSIGGTFPPLDRVINDGIGDEPVIIDAKLLNLICVAAESVARAFNRGRSEPAPLVAMPAPGVGMASMFLFGPRICDMGNPKAEHPEYQTIGTGIVMSLANPHLRTAPEGEEPPKMAELAAHAIKHGTGLATGEFPAQDKRHAA